jgi:hypothetical protein
LRRRAAEQGLDIVRSGHDAYRLTPSVPGLKRDIISNANLDEIEDWLNRRQS